MSFNANCSIKLIKRYNKLRDNPLFLSLSEVNAPTLNTMEDGHVNEASKRLTKVKS